MKRLSIEEICGRTIVGAGGQIIGEVSSLNIETDTWSVESLQAKLRDEVADQLGVKRSMFRSAVLELSVRIIQSIGDTVVLSVALQDLKKRTQEAPNESEPSAASR